MAKVDKDKFDQVARDMGNILGDSLDLSIENTEYRASRGVDVAETLALLRRAKELRDGEVSEVRGADSSGSGSSRAD